MVKNFLNKILVVIILLSCLVHNTNTFARQSYSSLFIKITDASLALKENNKEQAKNLIEQFKDEFDKVENSSSEAGKKVKEKYNIADDVNEEKLTELSTALLNFEKEQNPINIEAEKKSFSDKMYPAFDKLKKAVETKNVDIMKAEYVKYNSTWVRNEALVRDLEPTYYGKIETTMSFLRSSMEVNPFNYDTTMLYLTDLKTIIDDFLAGKKIEQNNEITTLEDGIKLLEESYNGFTTGDNSVGQAKMKKFIEVWPIIEGEVRTRNASLYTKVESEMPIIMVKGSEDKYKEQLKILITELSKIDTKSNYSAFDAMLILLREGVEALVIVISLASAVRVAKQKKGLKWIYGGAVLGIGISIIAAFILKYSFPTLSSGTNREIIEGFVGVFAVIMMIAIGIWLHSKSSVKAWKNYMDKKLGVVLSTGSFVSMFTLSFLAVFREGAETILFYAGILPMITMQNLILGIVLAIFALIVIALAMLKFADKIPLNKLFLVLSWLIYVLAFKMLGVSIHALQITNIIPNHIVANLPTIDYLGFYPSVETISMQILFILIVAYSFYYEKTKEKSYD